MVESTISQEGLKIVIFGATGLVGQHLVRQALELGHTVTAYVRNPDKLTQEHKNLIKIKGELNQAEIMEEAVKGQDAVLSSLGGRGLLSRDDTCVVGTKAIIAAMEKTGVKRLVAISSYGCGPGNRSHLPWAIRAMLYHPLAVKDDEEALILKSGLEYVIVRPPRLSDEPAKGDAYAHTGRITNMLISRADVANFMLKQIVSPEWVGQAVHLQSKAV